MRQSQSPHGGGAGNEGWEDCVCSDQWQGRPVTAVDGTEATCEGSGLQLPGFKSCLHHFTGQMPLDDLSFFHKIVIIIKTSSKGY